MNGRHRENMTGVRSIRHKNMIKTVKFYIGTKGLKMDIDLPKHHTIDDVMREIRQRIAIHSVTEPPDDDIFSVFGITNPFVHG